MSVWQDEKNARAIARLRKALPEIFPQPVLTHALRRPLIPPTPRLAIDSYWRAHPLRADRLARSLARRSGAPEGWAWRPAADMSFRTPPAPYREEAFSLGRGYCCICGQPAFKFGWHNDLWGTGASNRKASWHACCVAAWNMWTSPRDYLQALRKAQGRKCPMTGKRLLKSGEVDHRMPLYRVWRERKDTAWPDLLAFWGAPNLQVINRDGHLRKCQEEARERAAWRVDEQRVILCEA
ncbi:MAG: hypothetical protein K2X62_10805 [Beijerinckiaceae bacterium]|nr:hypothetical protein [Beijerinckiaceae bacterium]MDO9440245.1 hypothetical protein [Beijerinckiaceae bacterium]